MSKGFIARVIQENCETTGVIARHTANVLVDAIADELRKNGRFTVSGFGTFMVRKTRARNALNPRDGTPVRVKAGKTVKWKPSPVLRKRV